MILLADCRREASVATSLLTITFLVGLGLIVVSVLGGGIEIEVKELKIPTLGIIPRIGTFVLGSSLVILCIVGPSFFPDDPKNDHKKRWTIFW
jgi:hypothetical protein